MYNPQNNENIKISSFISFFFSQYFHYCLSLEKISGENMLMKPHNG